jgi:ornithine cyclodeaminase/alanine dehydrogenase-like protein (mu-crystallin family)
MLPCNENGKITKEELIELGTMISNKKYQRSSNDEITVVDLTGVAGSHRSSSSRYSNFKSCI